MVDQDNLQWRMSNLPKAAIRKSMVVCCAMITMAFLIVSQSETPIFIPSISLHYNTSPFNISKVALLIEDRPWPNVAPLMLHMMSVLPQDWRFRFMGSEESMAHLNSSRAIKYKVEAGKLDITEIPTNMSVAGGEQISQFLTNLWLYETVLQPAEWLLVFQTDSIFCANSHGNIDDWLDYDWVGAPWYENSRFGGNGGLSLRRVSSIVEVLKHQVRIKNSDPEDVWLSRRLGYRHGAKVANGSQSMTFSGEQLYSENPMGYHTGSSGAVLHGGIWGTPELRQKIYDYCPEVKMTVQHIDAAEYVVGDCGGQW